MIQQSVILERSEHIARITLNRPDQHNSLAGEDIALFHSHLEQIESDDAIRVTVITGSGDRTFCAGASLKEFRSGNMSGDLFTTLTDRIAALPMPSLCLLNGNVFGGGAEIALCCDYRIGVDSIRMKVPAAAIGLCYPLNGLQRYVDKLGLSTAKRILVAAETLDAQSMLQCGFLHRIVSAEELDTIGAEFTDHLAGLAPMATRAMKKVLHAIASGHCDEQQARCLHDACANSADLQEGLAAQRERRAPAFKGV